MAADAPAQRKWPEIDAGAPGLNGEWCAANRDGDRLTIQRCDDCAAWRHPPRLRCTTCGSGSLSFVRVDGAGSVVDYTVTYRALHPSFAGVVPYAIAVIELHEGPRLLSVVRTDDPEALREGDRVTLAVNEFGVPYALLVDSGV